MCSCGQKTKLDCSIRALNIKINELKPVPTDFLHVTKTEVKRYLNSGS